MDDRRASWVAAALGGIAIAGFGFARPTRPHMTLSLLDQWAPPTREGPDGDAAALFRVDLRSTGSVENHLVAFQIVGADGRGYPLVPSAVEGTGGTLKLPRGYAHRLESPRLVATFDDGTTASVPLRSVPAAEHHGLVPSVDPPIALVLHGESGLFAEPRRPMPQDECWRVVAHRTPYVDGLECPASVVPVGSRTARRLAVPFAEEASLVELDLTRYRLVPESDLIRLEGLRLVRRFGGTALIVDHAMRVPNRLGAMIEVPRQDNGPRSPLRHGDPRVGNLNLVLTPSWFSTLPYDLRRSHGPKIEVLGPAPESLGLRELRIACQSRTTARRSTPPLHEGLFSATVRVTFYHPVPLETRRMVLPVTVGRPVAYLTAAFPVQPSIH